MVMINFLTSSILFFDVPGTYMLFYFYLETYLWITCSQLYSFCPRVRDQELQLRLCVKTFHVVSEHILTHCN